LAKPSTVLLTPGLEHEQQVHPKIIGLGHVEILAVEVLAPRKQFYMYGLPTDK
jgi:hypothetical protein